MARDVSRRDVLAATAGSVGAAGCLGRIRNVGGREQSGQMRIDITTVPADSDPHAVRIARHLSEHLEAVGIESRMNTISETGLYREVLINHNFDVYVGQFPDGEPFDPDALYPLLHSQFNTEPGWQNPFGLTDPRVDELLEEQRRARDGRRFGVVKKLQEEIALHQPFIVVAFPEMLTAVRDDRFSGWEHARTTTPLGLLALDAEWFDGSDDITPESSADDDSIESANDEEDDDTEHDTAGANGVRDDDGGDDGDDSSSDDDGGDDGDDSSSDDDGGEDGEDTNRTLQLVTTDPRTTENLNPIAPEYRRYGNITGLLYDPLVRTYDGEPVQWLASGWNRVNDRTLRVAIRSHDWHDGTSIAASDVAFTYEFLADTSQGTAEVPIPTSRFRGRSTLVEEVDVIGEHTVEFTFTDANPTVQRRALTVPILPEHVWSEHTDLVELPGGININEETTEAQVWNNPEPVGCGPIRFVEAVESERVVFERNDDHPIVTEPESFPDWIRRKPAFDELELEVVPSDVAGVQRVGDGLADATASNLGPDAIPRVGREARARLVSNQSAAFYHIGFNTRNEPLSNPNFRRAIAGLIDNEWLVETAFNGYARPATSAFALSEEWIRDDHRWDDDDPITPFTGTNGTIDEQRAREAFTEIGYRYNDDGDLLVRES